MLYKVDAIARGSLIPYCRNQGGAARGFVPVVGVRDGVDDVMWIAFGNGAVAMSRDWATAYIADAGDGDAVDCDVAGADAFDLAAVRGGVA